MATPLRLLFALFFCALLAAAGWLSTAGQVDAGGHARAAPPDPVCAEALTLSMPDGPLALGDVFAVTATLANRGNCLIGLPRYALRTASDEVTPVLAPVQPPEIFHSLGIGPGREDAARFDLEVVGTGLVTLTAYADFEVHVDYPGPAYWAGATSLPLSITVPPTGTLARVIHATGHASACSQLDTYGTVYYGPSGFTCIVTPGHSRSLSVAEFADAAAADLAFRESFSDTRLSLYRCYPAASWSSGGFGPLVHTHHTWVAERWIIYADNEDDTSLYAGPRQTSDLFYAKAVDLGLLESCVQQQAYLPWVDAR